MTKENRLLTDIRNHLDQGTEQIDTDMARKIQQARYAALAQQADRRFSWKIPLSGMTAAAVVALVAFFSLSGPSGPSLTPEQVEMVEMLTSGQNLELFENMDFSA